MQDSKSKHVVLYMRSIPVEVKTQFKAWCASNGITMTEKMIELMRETYKPTNALR